MGNTREPKDDALPDKILAKLAAAGAAGLATSKLPGAAADRKEALRRLSAERRIGNLGTENKARYVLAEHFQPLELAAAHVERKATPGRATAYTLPKLEAGSAGEVRQQVRKAVETLTKQRVLLKISLGKTSYWLHTASIQPLMPEADDFASAAAPPRPKLTDAYARAKRAEGFSDVPISLLQRESGLEMNALHEALLELSRSGQAVLSLGDWSLAADDERAAAFYLDGRQYLRVRLLDALT